MTLRSYTQASALAESREHIKGRPEPGFVADFVVLDRDVTRVAPQDLPATELLRTVVGGPARYLDPGDAACSAQRAAGPGFGVAGNGDR